MKRVVGSAVIGLTLLCAAPTLSQPTPTFTRKEVLSLSPQELAARVLAAVAAKGTAKEHKVYISPVVPTLPWLEEVRIEMPAVNEDHEPLCERQILSVQFEPVDFDAAKSHTFDPPSAYDPPVQVRRLDFSARYAAISAQDENSTACTTLPQDKFFDAPDRFSALRAVNAFEMFRAESANPKSTTAFTCQDNPKEGGCKRGWQKDIAVFYDVLSIQEETDQSAAHTRTLVLAPKPVDGRNADELWLTVYFGAKGAELTKARYVVQWRPPVL